MKGGKKAIYIGQTSLHLFGRASKHISHTLGNGTEQEQYFHKVVKGNGGNWWEDLIFIPLETIPLPDRNGQAPKPGTHGFVSEFQIRATPREQAWIQQLKTFRPHGLNVEVHTTSKKSAKRQASQNQSPSPPPRSYADAAHPAARSEPHQPPINYGRGKGKGGHYLW